MGVSGLLRLVQPYSEVTDVGEFHGKTLGVDAFSWLHRAAICCAEQLVKGEFPTKLLQSIDNRVRVYERAGVNLYFVFDGAPLKMKERIANERRKARESARNSAERSVGAESMGFLKRAVEINFDHCAMLIEYLRTRHIMYVIAPYEADAQLVFLEQLGLINGIISEDSDMLVFGACKLLTKCDAATGQSVVVDASKFPKNLGRDYLRALAIISGCDYSPGIAGFGPIKSLKIVEANHGCLEQVLRYMKRIDRCNTEFVNVARNANAAFLFQRVWDPTTNKMSFLNEPSVDLMGNAHKTLSVPSELNGVDTILSGNVIGEEIDAETALKLSKGHINPRDFKQTVTVPSHISTFLLKMTPFVPSKMAPLVSKTQFKSEIEKRLGTRAPCALMDSNQQQIRGVKRPFESRAQKQFSEPPLISRHFIKSEKENVLCKTNTSSHSVKKKIENEKENLMYKTFIHPGRENIQTTTRKEPIIPNNGKIAGMFKDFAYNGQ